MTLPHYMKLTRPVAQGDIVTWDDVGVDPTDPTVTLRREIERAFPPAN